MKVLMSTFGTARRRPAVCGAGQGLQAAGYEVAVCTPEGFKSFVTANGLDYAFVDNEFLALTEQGLRARARVAGWQ